MRVLLGLVAVVGLRTGTGQTLRAHASRSRGPRRGYGLEPI
jgi:hypothetical protein